MTFSAVNEIFTHRSRHCRRKRNSRKTFPFRSFSPRELIYATSYESHRYRVIDRAPRYSLDFGRAKLFIAHSRAGNLRAAQIAHLVFAAVKIVSISSQRFLRFNFRWKRGSFMTSNYALFRLGSEKGSRKADTFLLWNRLYDLSYQLQLHFSRAWMSASLLLFLQKFAWLYMQTFDRLYHYDVNAKLHHKKWLNFIWAH